MEHRPPTPLSIPRRPEWRNEVVRKHTDRYKASSKQTELNDQLRECETDDEDANRPTE